MPKMSFIDATIDAENYLIGALQNPETNSPILKLVNVKTKALI